jgi:inorganic pyrophosphatase
MIHEAGKAFWEEMARLAASEFIVIDRPMGSTHPYYSDLIYPFDYGYIDGTLAADGDGIDVWIGSQGHRVLTGILCTFDTIDKDAEIKLMLGCSDDDIEIIVEFLGNMRTLYIPRPLEDK